MKKKKRLDPAFIKYKEEKKRMKLERDIRRLLRVPQQLKPLPEIDIEYNARKELK